MAIHRAVAGGAACVCAFFGLSTPAAAQSATDETARERVVVTATRRDESLDDQAVSIGVLDAEALQRINADHPQEALNRVPGVFIHRNSGQEHLTAIRSPVLTGGAGAGSFLFLEDGVPLRAAGFANVNGLFEALTETADAVEVVRGPGSALYGSNAVHGMINVVSPAPTETGGVVQASLASFDRRKASGRAAWAGESGGVLAAASLLDENGWRDEAGVDQQKLFLRWDGTEGPWSWRASLSGSNLNQETASFVRGDDIYRDSQASRENPDPEAFRDAQAVRGQVRFDYAARDDLTISLTPYARWNTIEFIQFFNPSEALETTGHWSVGGLAAAYWDVNSAVSVVAGVDAEFTRGELFEFQENETVGSFVQGLHYDYEVDAQVLAGYAEAEFSLAPEWTLEAGARLEAVRYEYDNAAPDDIVGRFQRPADRTDDFFTATPKLALIRSLPGGASAYARYARGARAPQTTDLYRLQANQTVGEIDPETLDSVELGWRGVLLGAQIDAAAFAMEKRDFFFRDADGFNVPDGRTRHLGVELAASGDLTEQVGYALSATYTRQTYRFDRPVSNVSESITKGDDIDTAPRWLANARLTWSPAARVRAETEIAYVGRYYMDASNSVTYPGHTLVNLRVDGTLTEAVSLFAAVRNATNTDYAERADFAFGSERYFPGEDRAYSAGLRVAF